MERVSVLYLLGSCAFLSACATVKTEEVVVNAQREEQPISVIQLQQEGDFSTWKAQFRTRALAAGIKTFLVDQLLARATFDPNAIQKDRNQPEHSKMVWQYLDTAVSADRIQLGRNELAQNESLLSQIESQYKVPREVLIAIWGIETGYGATMGNSDLVSSLATIGYDGRRQEFAEQQLIALLTLLERGSFNWYDLRGSWAGGMGHMQFIPSTFLQYGVDGDGDGQVNPWNKADALTSAANYLAQSGWVEGEPWGVEVRLPADFSDSYVEENLPVAQWRAMGIQPVGSVLSDDVVAMLSLPGGKSGPAFLLTENFNVIRKYNRAYNYSLAVGLLADAISTDSSVMQPWPREQQGIQTSQIKTLQAQLKSQGFDVGNADGILGEATRRAFRQWQRAHGQFADGFISQQSTSSLLP